MGALAQKAKALRPTTKQSGPECGVRKALASLDQEDADALHHLIFGRLDLNSIEVSAFLIESGIEISDRTVRHHRQDTCKACRTKGAGS